MGHSSPTLLCYDRKKHMQSEAKPYGINSKEIAHAETFSSLVKWNISAKTITRFLLHVDKTICMGVILCRTCQNGRADVS